MSKPKILYVIADASQTGAPRQVYYLARGLVKEYEVHLACPKGWLSDEAEKCGATIHRLDNSQSIFKLKNNLASLYQTIKPDIIHCHGVRAGVAARWAEHGKIPMVYTEHVWTADFHLLNPLRERFQLLVLKYLGRKKTTHTVAVSEVVRRFITHQNMAAPRHTSVIYGAIEPITPAAPVAQPIIGTMGRLTWVKGVDILLRALPDLLSTTPELTCWIGGDGPDKPGLENLANELGVAKNVRWMGEVKQPDWFYRQLQIYVHPALTESFGLAPLEAMSAGIPVVASRAGALPEIIKDQQSGLLFTPGDAKALAEAVNKLLTSKKLRAQISASGHERSTEFSIDKFLENHDHLYHQLLHGSSN